MVNHLACATQLCEVPREGPNPARNRGMVGNDDSWPIRPSWRDVAYKVGFFRLDMDDFARNVLLHSRLTGGTPQNMFPLYSEVGGESIFGAMLCLVHNLQTLRLHCPHEYILTRFVPFEQIRYTELDRIINTALTNPKIHHLPPLRKLRTLHLLPAMEVRTYKPMPSRQLGIDGVFRSCIDICPALLMAPILRNVLVARPAGGNWRTVPQQLNDFNKFLRGTRSNRPSVVYEWLGNILSLPHLRKLQLYKVDNAGWIESPDDKDPLNSQLIKTASRKLETFLLSFRPNMKCDEYSMNQIFGPAMHLHCLADFSVLRELDIPLFALIGPWRNLKNVRLETKLPVSLQTLALREMLWYKVLIEEWWGPEWREDYGHDLHNMFQRFANSYKARCPDLRVLAWGKNEYMARELHRGNTKDLFLNTDITFVEWMDDSSHAYLSTALATRP